MLNMKIDIPILNKKFTIIEPSFNDYKNLVKQLQSTDEDEVFENFLNQHIENQSTNVLEKFLLLLNLRGLVLGNKFELELEKKQYAIDINEILEVFETEHENLKIEKNGYIYNFGFVKDFKDLKLNKLEFIARSLTKINEKDIKDLDIDDIVNLLPALEFNELYEKIYTTFYSKFIEYKFLEAKIYLGNSLGLIKAMFDTNLLDLYKLEYICRKNLNFTSSDFDNMSLPESRILLNYHNEDVKKENERYEKLRKQN